MKVALVSLNQSWEDKEANRLKVRKCFQTIAPQYGSCDFPGDDFNGLHHECEGTCRGGREFCDHSFFTDCACQYGVYIGFGMILKSRYKSG